MSKRFLNIAPTNAGTGVFSFSGAGNPQIIFNIADVGLLQHYLRHPLILCIETLFVS